VRAERKRATSPMRASFARSPFTKSNTAAIVSCSAGPIDSTHSPFSRLNRNRNSSLLRRGARWPIEVVFCELIKSNRRGLLRDVLQDHRSVADGCSKKQVLRKELLVDRFARQIGNKVGKDDGPQCLVKARLLPVLEYGSPSWLKPRSRSACPPTLTVNSFGHMSSKRHVFRSRLASQRVIASGTAKVNGRIHLIAKIKTTSRRKISINGQRQSLKWFCGLGLKAPDHQDFVDLLEQSL
jgi:hypothetical protein